MMKEEIVLRLATPADAPALVEIYAPYVEETPITFEYEVPTAQEFSRRIKTTLEKYPYLVAELDGVPVGYAYASAFKARAAYNWAVETSVYVKHGAGGKGIGKSLYQGLEAALKAQNVENVNACITDFPGSASIPFHQKLGYKTVARFTKCGYKLGIWWDMVWMEKFLGEHPNPPRPFIPLPQLERREK